MNEELHSCRMCQDVPAIKGERFCRSCRKQQVMMMTESGYLQPLPKKTAMRPFDWQEDVMATKYGSDR